MRKQRFTATLAAGAVAMALAAAPVAQADRDEAFADRLHTFGVYGQKDFNAWIAKIMCKRLHRGVDADVYASAKFVHSQLQNGSSTEQAWQFVGAAIPAYCPELTHVLTRAADDKE
ncbi:DUF732 domain-containing protein [Mycolicibacterium bacteremicum]|uniref:DUF732 domain-containing protein n=1 Tax=Mycolicibacterium bacteremicum TaxID=564198 RepID=A0A1W9Z2J3_MYCBA|nr:DUF732 domain-containing protein [Mycolicibacterium bacteremicum]MCV7432006.1 DUF732 domain-containing protein [Mycolicibacterium bacteremicum]ORA06556.1 hypothetical protein BST17_02555 [Mycolicibacterium bacteremicum]